MAKCVHELQKLSRRIKTLLFKAEFKATSSYWIWILFKGILHIPRKLRPARHCPEVCNSTRYLLLWFKDDFFLSIIVSLGVWPNKAIKCLGHCVLQVKLVGTLLRTTIYIAHADRHPGEHLFLLRAIHCGQTTLDYIYLICIMLFIIRYHMVSV